MRSLLVASDDVAIDPRLIVFSPGRFADECRVAGIDVTVLESRHRRQPFHALRALHRDLASRPPAIVHTHGYKANVVGRLARATGARMRGLVATAHGWPDETLATRAYNALDRASAFLSDRTTVTAPDMVARFPRGSRAVFVANAVPDRPLPSRAERAAARRDFGFPPERIVVGFLGRTSAAKGVHEFLACARACAREPYEFAIAGTGDLDEAIAAADLPGLRALGYVARSETFLDAIDIFVQTSHAEGLSLALLEAMRAGRALVVTDVGATAWAVRDGIDGIVVPPRDVENTVATIRALASDADRRDRLGKSARERFAIEFKSDRFLRDFAALYREIDRKASRRPANSWRRGGSNS